MKNRKLISVVLATVMLFQTAFPSGTVFAADGAAIAAYDEDSDISEETEVTSEEDAPYDETVENEEHGEERLGNPENRTCRVTVKNAAGETVESVEYTDTVTIVLSDFSPAVSEDWVVNEDPGFTDSWGEGIPYYRMKHDGVTVRVDAANNTITYENVCLGPEDPQYDTYGAEPGEYKVSASVCEDPVHAQYMYYSYYSTNTFKVVRSDGGPSITTRSLPDMVEGEYYHAQLEAEGEGPFTWSENGGYWELSWTGLSLSSDGVISGTVTIDPAGGMWGNELSPKYTLNINPKVTDSKGRSVTKAIPAECYTSGGGSPRIATSYLYPGRVNVPYEGKVIAEGGGGFTSLTAKGLPSGLSMSKDGIISGTPTEQGEFKVSVNAVPVNNEYDPVEKTLDLKIKGEALKVSISSDIIAKAQGRTCLLYGSFGEEDPVCFGSVNPAVLKGDDYLKEVSYSYGQNSVHDIILGLYLAGKNDMMVLASTPKGQEYVIEGSQTAVLSENTEIPDIIKLPSKISFETPDGKQIDGMQDSYSCVFTCSKGNFSSGEVVTDEIKSYVINLGFYHYVYSSHPDLDFASWYIKGKPNGDSRRYNLPVTDDTVKVVVPLFKKDAKLKGKLYYALSDDTPAEGKGVHITQQLPGTTYNVTVKSGADGSFETDVYPGFDVNMYVDDLAGNRKVAAEDLAKEQKIYLPAGYTAARLNLNLVLSGKDDDATKKYLKALGQPVISLESFLGDKPLVLGTYFVDSNGRQEVHRIWTMSAYDELIALSKKPSDRSVTMKWNEGAVFLAGSADIKGLDTSLCGEGSIELPVRGGIVITAHNKSTISASYKAYWFDHSTGAYAGESASRQLYGEYDRDLAFPCSGKAGVYDVVIMSDNMYPQTDSFNALKEKYSKDSTMAIFENVTIEDKKGVYAGEVNFDEAALTGAIYITQPGSNLSSYESCFNSEELIPITGSLVLDKGYSGRIERIYALSKGGGQIEYMRINGTRYLPEDDQYYSNFNFDDMAAPVSYTVYLRPEFEKDVDITLYTDIDADTAEGEKKYKGEPLGRIVIKKPGIGFTAPEITGSAGIYTRLSVPDKSHVYVYDGDTLIYDEYYEKKFEGSVKMVLSGCTGHKGETHKLHAKAVVTDKDEKSSESVVDVSVMYQEGAPTIKNQYLELVRDDGTVYSTVQSGGKYNNTWMVKLRICVEFENYENLDEAYSKTLTGESAPAVGAIQMHSGWQSALYPLKGKGGVYKSEVISGHTVENVEILFAPKNDAVDYDKESIEVDLSPDETAGGKVKGTTLEKLAASGAVDAGRAEAASVYTVELDKKEYAAKRTAITESVKSVSDDPAKVKKVSDGLKKEGIYYVDPSTGKIDKDKGPEWTHSNGSGEFVSAVDMLDKAKDAKIPEGSYAYSGMVRNLTEEQYIAELKKMMDRVTIIAEYDPPYYDDYRYEGDFNDMEITYYDDYMPINSIVVTDETGAVMEETYTIDYPGETFTGQVTINRVPQVDETGTPTGGFDFIETGDLLVTGTGEGSTGNPGSDGGTGDPFTGDGGGFGFLDPNGGGTSGGYDSFTAYGDARGAKGVYDAFDDFHKAFNNSGGGNNFGFGGADGQLLNGSINTMMSMFDFASETMSLMDVKMAAKKLLNSPCANKLPRATYENMKRNYDNFVKMVNDAEAWSTSLALLNSLHAGAQSFGLYNAGGLMGKCIDLTVSGGLYGANFIKRMKMQNVANESKMFIDMLKLFIWKMARQNNDWNCLQALMKDKQNTSQAKYTPYIDPSGTVYEGVLSNPVSGADVKLYVRDDSADDGLAPADPDTIDPQINVQTADINGYYSWLVSEGSYFVSATAQGRGDGDSQNDVQATVKGDKHDYLPVPPPQLDVNIPIMNYEAPYPKLVTATTDGVYIRFDKYMDEDSLKSSDALVLRDKYGNRIDTVLELLDSETEPDNIKDDERGTYARTVKLGANLKAGSDVVLSVDESVLSYCGVSVGVLDAVTVSTVEKTKAPVPVLDPQSAQPGVIGSKMVVIFAPDDGDEVFYTTDGSDPVISKTARKYNGAFAISGDITVNAYTKRLGCNDSDIVSFAFVSPDNTSKPQGNTDWAKAQEDSEREVRRSQQNEKGKEAVPKTEETYVYKGTIHTYTITYGTNLTYNGKKQKSAVNIKLEDGTQLTKKDFSVKYKNNKNAGEAQLYVTLKKAYKADKKPLNKTALKFDILKFKATEENVTYKKVKKGKASSLKVAGLKVKKNEYLFDEASLTITFSGNFEGVVKVDPQKLVK